MELYVFSQDEQLLTILSEDTGLVETLYRIEVNSIPAEPFSFTVESDHKVAEHVKEENKVVFKDHEGDWRLMNIKEVDDSNDTDGPITIATCEPAFLAELNEHIVVDRQFVGQTADVALAAAVEGTRWQAAVEVELGRAGISFYYISSTEAIWKTIEVWGGEFKDIVNFDEVTNTITSCYVKIIQRLGADNGQRFEIDHNTTEIGRTVLSYPKTAFYGQGASLETENDDITRYIDFGDAEWRTSRGDPVDKPLGQKWVGDSEALDKYGILEGNKKRHRYGTYSNQDYEEPLELLAATWNSLQKSKNPEVNYRLSVDLFNEKISLGDTCQAIDRMFARPIEIQARVIAMEYDLMDMEGTMVVEMGQFLDIGDNRLDNLEREVEGIRSRPPSARIDENSYPDRKPSTPVNLEAYGGMEVIQLYWQYADEMFIKHYEVYGSRTEDFVPDTQHLLWRGDVSAFAHPVGTDEVWYYRVRAVNYHGRPSDWSVQVQAATQRVLTEDILWGPELAERIRELHRVSDIIGKNGVDFGQISEEAKNLINQKAKSYTDEEIETSREDILKEMGIKTDYLDNRIAEINDRADSLVNRADSIDDDVSELFSRAQEMDNTLDEHGDKFTSIETEIDEVDNRITANIVEMERLDDVLESHSTELIAQAGLIASKVDAIYVEDAIGDLEYENRNFIFNSTFNDGKNNWRNVSGMTTSEILSPEYDKPNSHILRMIGTSATPIHNANKFKVYPGDVFTISFDIRVDNLDQSGVIYSFRTWEADLEQPDTDNGASIGVSGDDIHLDSVINAGLEEGKWLRYSHTVKILEERWLGSGVYSKEGLNYDIREIKLEKGNKATSWSPAPEETTEAISSVREFASEIEQTAQRIGIDLNALESSHSNLNQTVEQNALELELQADSIRGKLDEITYTRDKEGILESIEQNTLDIKATAEGLRLNADSIINIDDLVKEAQAEMNIMSDEINERVTKTIFDNETGDLRQSIAGVRNFADGIQQTVRTVQSETNERLSIAETEITQLDREIALKVNADGIVSELNLMREGIRLSGALIYLDGLSLIDEAIIQNTHIANGTIQRAKLARAIIGTAQIDDLAVTSAKIASVNADKVNAANLQAISGNMGTLRSGRLLSSNNNMDLNLNTGNLTMRNANFTLGNGARIEFTSVGNRIQYSDVKNGTIRSAGFGVGKSLQDYPFAYSGTTGAANLNTLSEYYSGAMWHTTRAISEGAANSISGFRFMLRNRAVDWDKGVEFDFNGTPTIRPLAHGAYDIGTSNYRFRRIYVDNVLGWRTVYISNPTANRGFAIDTDHVDGHNPSIYGQYPANNNYNIGRNNRYMTYVYTNTVRANYLYGALQGNSARKFKKNEDSMDLADSLEFIRNAKIVTFDWIRDETMKFNKDNPQTIYDRQVGFILDDLQMRNDYLIKSNEESIKKDNILFMHQHVLQDNLRRLDSIDEELNWQHIEYQYINNEVTKLKEENKALKERVKNLEERIA